MEDLKAWTVTQRLAPVGNVPDDFDQRWDRLERALAESNGVVYPVDEDDRRGGIVAAFRVLGAVSQGEAIVRAHANWDEVVSTLEPFRDYMRVGLPDPKPVPPGRRGADVPMAQTRPR